MPRVTELVGYTFGVGDTEINETDQNGQIIFNGNGQPKTITGKVIVFVDPLGDQVKVSLGDAARQELVKLLTGGIVVIGGNLNDLPPPG